MPAPDPLDIAARIGPKAAVTVERLRRLLRASGAPKSLNRLYRELGGPSTTLRRHLAMAKRAGFVTWENPLPGSRARRISIPGVRVKQANQLGMTRRDEGLRGRDAGGNRGAQNAGPNAVAELGRDPDANVGIQQRGADDVQRIARVRIGQRRRSAQGSDRGLKPGAQSVKHARKSSDDARFGRDGFPVDAGPGTRALIEHIRAMIPVRYAAQSTRKAIAALLDSEGPVRTIELVTEAIRRGDRVSQPAAFFSALAVGGAA